MSNPWMKVDLCSRPLLRKCSTLEKQGSVPWMMRAIESEKKGREPERQVRLRQGKNSQNLIFHRDPTFLLSHRDFSNSQIFYKTDVSINCTLVDPSRVDHLSLT